MKKILFYASMAILFTSCLGDEDDSKFKIKETLKLANLVIPESETEEPYVLADVKYDFELEHIHNTAIVRVEDMMLDMHTKLSFESNPVQSSSNNYTQGSVYRFSIENISTLVNGMYNAAYQIEDMNCMLTTAYYAPTEMLQQNPAPLGRLAVMSYEIGDLYDVKSFPVSAFYSGETKTYYVTKGGSEKTFSSRSALYGVNMNLAEKTADIVIYDAQFAEEMPMKLTMMLKGLNIEFTREGYVIKGENIVPLVGNDAIEYPQFAFNEFVFECNDEFLINANVKFTVAGQYRAEFSGKYLIQ